MAHTLKLIHQSPSGAHVWAVSGQRYQIVWLGPGTRLYLGFDAMTPKGQLSLIEHYTADKRYDTATQARRAALAFLDAPPLSRGSRMANRSR